MKQTELLRKTPLKRSSVPLKRTAFFTAVKPVGVKTDAPKTRPKPRRRDESTWDRRMYRTQAVELAKAIVRRKTAHCERCAYLVAKGLRKPENTCKIMQGSHVFSVGGHPDMSATLENIQCLGNACHIYWWHKEPAEAWEWFKELYPSRAKKLEERAGRVEKQDWREQYSLLKGIHDAL